MRISLQGSFEISTFENTVLKLYKDERGIQTIGTGHALTLLERIRGYILINGVKVPFNHGLTLLESNNLFKQDLIPSEVGVNNLVKVPLSQCQFDTMTSLCFNMGVNELKGKGLLSDLNQGRYELIPNHIKLYDKVLINGKLVVSDGLVKRREKECDMWNNRYILK